MRIEAWKRISGSLQAKVLLPFCLFIVLTTVATPLLITWTVSDPFHDLSSQRSQLMVHAIQHQAELAGNIGELQRFVTSIGAEPDVNRIVVVAGDPPRVLAGTQSAWLGKGLDDLPIPALRQQLLAILHTRDEHQEILSDTNEISFASPLSLIYVADMKNNNSHGAVAVSIDAARLDAILTQTAWRTGSWTVGLVGILAVLVFALLHVLVIRPASRIRVAIQAQSRGELQARVLATGSDEIAELARTLNWMLDLQNGKELELQKLAVKATLATRAKTDFLANMSHEIRTPMAAILGFAEALMETELSEQERRDGLATICRNSQHLLTIINDILDLSKIEAGKMTTEKIACQPCEVLADIASLVKVRVDAKGLSWGSECCGSIPRTIQSDPTRLRQIIINLVGNAIKFTETGGVRVLLRWLADAPSRLQFDVIDTGIGMTPEQRNQLFQPFSQADETMVRRFGGTGLGLAISSRFAELLGGDLQVVDSEAGVGTRFRLTIPTGSLEEVEIDEQPSAARLADRVSRDEIAATPKTSPKSLSGLRVLLAEDGPDNQRLISFLVRKAGAEVTVADNGQAAVDLVLSARAEGLPYDVILMDMQMPIMDGYHATMRLREMDYEGSIIALTAHAMASDREKCINSGCNEFLTKPVDSALLIKTIRAQAKAGATRHLASGPVS